MQMFCLCFLGGQGETGVAGPKSFPNKICDTGIFKRHFGSMSGPPDTHRMNGGWGLLLVQSWFEVTFLAMVTECPVGPRFQASPLEPRRPCPAPGLQVTDAQGSGESCPAFCPLCPSPRRPGRVPTSLSEPVSSAVKIIRARTFQGLVKGFAQDRVRSLQRRLHSKR